MRTLSVIAAAALFGAACADVGSVGVAPEELSSVSVDGRRTVREVSDPAAVKTDTAHVQKRHAPLLVGARVLADGRIVRNGAVLGRLKAQLAGASPDIGGTATTQDTSSPMAAAADGDVTCWYYITYYADTGEIISVTLLGCSGGGGSSPCTADQEAIAAEYAANQYVDGDWECDMFDDVVTNGTGTHGHDYGYLSSSYTSGRSAVWSYMSSNHGVTGWINSDWRCPVGNSLLPGAAANSLHMEGLAGDFDANGFDEDMWLQFQAAAINAGATDWSGFAGGDPDNQREYNYSTRIHIEW